MQEREFQTKSRGASLRGLTPLGEVIQDVLGWLESLRTEAERGAEQRGPLRGRVTSHQQPWSRALDRIAGDREAAAS